MNYSEKISIWKSQLLSEDTIDSSVCDSLYIKILSIEEELLKLGPSNYIKVSENSVTARHQYYNLLRYDWEELQFIKSKIVETSKSVLGGDSFLVKMWANIYRKGDYILKHIHHAEPIIETDEFKQGIFNTFCGHLFIGNDIDSETIYYFNEKSVAYKNNKGDIHFFSCVVPHEVLPYEGNIRISLAFDVYRDDFFDKLSISPIPNLIKIK